MPFSRSADSGRLVREHNNSTPPDSRIGSLLGLNSNSKLHKVLEATVNKSPSPSPLPIVQ